MRLWTIHPGYLDAKGLVAAWREALLAQKVLEGGTRGYTRHPQLERFRSCDDPLAAIGAFLAELGAEGRRRGYSFDIEKIHQRGAFAGRITVGSGQVEYEFELLKAKLERRDPARARENEGASPVVVGSVFLIRSGGIEPWERALPEILARMGEQ
jgi:hypothetical protein